MSLRTNLLEGSRVRGQIHLPNHVITGYQDDGRVGPDGSLDLAINYPDSIDEDDEMYVRLEFNPNASAQWEIIKEHYGEEGENLEGEHVTDYLERQIIRLDIQLQ